ncbi:hypothetical protein HY640_04430 [Candidatus Woesearchaeota archaeon]|nr:hypothetical protein [Candidatus Woesearchaeota archaeon]
MIELIDDVASASALVKRSISRFGSSPEHNYNYYMNIQEAGVRNVFVNFGRGRGILAQRFNSSWQVIGDVLAPYDERIELLSRALDGCVKGREKFVVETSADFRKRLSSYLKPGSRYHLSSPRFTLHWPVFDLRSWNGEKLQGGKWKKLRNIRNHFYKNNRVRVVDASDVRKEKLRLIVAEWVKRRKQSGVDRIGNNREYYERYMNFVDGDFEGAKYAKCIMVNGEPCSITAGWEIPNSFKEYYSAIGIYSYRQEGLGEVANIEDLMMLKRARYRYVDFGGSPKSLLYFKLKFKPTSVYKSYTYAIRKRQ